MKPIVFGLLNGVLLIPYRAFILAHVWAWYIAPAWPQLAGVGKWNIYGLATFVGIAIGARWHKEEKYTTYDWVALNIWPWVISTIGFFFAWLIKVVCL